jgi:hypothetical protein
MSRISDPEMADIVIDAPVPRKPDREARYLDNEVLVGFDTEWDAKNKETTPLLSLQFATYRIEPDGCRGSLVSRWYEPPGPRVRCDELVEYVIRFLDDVGVKQMAKTRGGSRVVSVVLLAHFAQAEISMIENPLRDVVIQQIAGKAHHGRLPDYSSFFVFSIGEMEAIIAALPEYATSKRSGLRFPVRARFVIAWEYALRPQTLNKLSVPEHYRQGAVGLVISDAIDKNRFGRPLAVSSGARNALDSVIPAVPRPRPFALVLDDEEAHSLLRTAWGWLGGMRACRLVGQDPRASGVRTIVRRLPTGGPWFDSQKFTRRFRPARVSGRKDGATVRERLRTVTSAAAAKRLGPLIRNQTTTMMLSNGPVRCVCPEHARRPNLPNGFTHNSDQPCPFEDTGIPLALVGTCCWLGGYRAVSELQAFGYHRLVADMHKDMSCVEASGFARDLRRAADRIEGRHRKPELEYDDLWDFEDTLAAIRTAACWFEQVADLGFGVFAWY